ncbi:uncharacterized protein BXIN_2035 [Babesia sp. Xinjiang]|uniref:uncharacterized protein n=1 Tax=Babesia sp. Xinjiang TaxID=462227 RepID=UPI000A22A7E2|nr:uncharacterized protein BXIN_2035 [Babesia sp. Xinjiang]ORM40327.1 hypothetical protein BXIN_2035 [Babesia sp. Xinjiang]
MEKAVADFSILWGKVGPFCDLSKVLSDGTSEPAEPYGDAWLTTTRRQKTSGSIGGQDFEVIYGRVRETELLAKLARLHARWNNLLFDIEQQLDELITLHERCIRGIDDLTLRQATYRINFKHVNQKFNALSERKASLSEKLVMLEEMHNHYAQYKCFARSLYQIENNEFINTASAKRNGSTDSSEAVATDPGDKPSEDNERAFARTLDYVDKIAEKLNAMLPAIDASIDFFSIHTNYFDADATRYKYEALRTSVFGLIKLVFKELYNFASDSCKGLTHFDVAEHYNKYRRIGSSVRKLCRYYTIQATELSSSEFLQLQMYYITSRIRILNPLMLLKMESFKDFGTITSFFLLICNLEILTFKETFVSEASHESLVTLVENVVFYFTEACNKQVGMLHTSSEMRAAISRLKQNLMDPISASRNDAVLRPLMLRAQQTYQTIELTLVKTIQRELAEHVRNYDKKPFLDVLCDNVSLEPDWDHELLAQVGDTDMRGAGLCPPVCFAVGIVLTNVDYLSVQNLNGIATGSLNAVKAVLIDVQYAFGKKSNLSANLVRINQDFFLMRHLQHVLAHLDRFRELDAYRTIANLYSSTEHQLCSGVSGLLLGDFREFVRRQRVHDEALYKERLSAAMSILSNKVPLLKCQLLRHLLPARFEHTFEQITAALREMSGEYAKKFSLEQPEPPNYAETSDTSASHGVLLQL